MSAKNLEELEQRMGKCWEEILSTPLAKEIQTILCSGDRKLYGMWLCQVTHLTKHTSCHQALVATRIDEITHQYAKFCLEHASEEVGHELMALNDLKRIGANINNINDLPEPLPATTRLNAYLYYAAQRAHPLTRLGFSYWAEKCYPFIAGLAGSAKKSLGLEDRQMTFFVNHSDIDEKHAQDVERIIQIVCKSPDDWAAVESGMVESLNLAIGIFEEIFKVVSQSNPDHKYHSFLNSIKAK